MGGAGPPADGRDDRLARVDEQLLVEETVTCVVQVQGKVRARLEVAPDVDAAELERLALADPAVQRVVDGRDGPPGRRTAPGLVNVVV